MALGDNKLLCEVIPANITFLQLLHPPFGKGCARFDISLLPVLDLRMSSALYD